MTNNTRQYWLMKSEIKEYSWEQLQKDKRTFWDGVRNYQARNHLKKMRVGDFAFFYHSNVGKNIVGITKIVRESYPDPTHPDQRWVMVDIVPQEELASPVTLAQIKENPALANMQLVKNSRLSVQVVQRQEWDEILSMSRC